MVFITQFMEEVALAERAIVMNNGEIAMDTSPRRLFENVDFLKSMNLKAPQIPCFCSELNELGESISASIFDPKECANELAIVLKRE